jgi:hypothetical protein
MLKKAKKDYKNYDFDKPLLRKIKNLLDQAEARMKPGK